MAKKTKDFSILKTARKRRGYSQEALAGLSGVSMRAIQDIESGRSNPTTTTLDALAGALGVPLSELLPSSEHSASPPSMALSATAIPAPSASDLVAVAAEFLAVSPRRRAMVLAWLFDDPAFLPANAPAALYLRPLPVSK